MRVALNLPIERKWLDMIASGKKKEEYRDCEHRQCVRLYNETGRNGCVMPDNLVAVLRNGYKMNSRAVAVEIVGMTLRGGYEAKHPEWGEPKGRRAHLVVMLGEVVAQGTYAEVKQSLTVRTGKVGE